MKKTNGKKAEKNLEVINPHAAGIDIGSKQHYVAVSSEKTSKPIREFGTTTAELKSIVSWFKAIGVTTVAMESTGIYWICLYDMLESHGIEVYLVNARHTKNVSGRKTDVSDCEWIRKLHSYGLLSRSFIPNDLIRKLQSYVRQRETMETQKAIDITKIGTVLHKMNIKLQNIVSDLEGMVAMNIIRDISAGACVGEELVNQYWTKQMKASREEAILSLQGNYREDNLFILEQALSSYDFHKSKMLECDKRIEDILRQMQAISNHIQTEKEQVVERVEITKKKGKRRKNELSFDAREYLRAIAGVDLIAVDGFEVNTVLTIISEVGTDLSKFKTKKQFTSWLRLAPNAKISGGRIIGYQKNTTSSRASKAFRLSARSLHSSKSPLGEMYRRISARKGPAVAIKAIARKLAIIYYVMITTGSEYKKENSLDLELKNEKRMIKNIETKAKKLGYELVKKAS